MNDSPPTQSATTRTYRGVLALLMLIYAALTLALILRVPLGAAPDESAHILYVERLAQTREFPVFTAKSANEAGYEFHQPPLYYTACATLWNALGAGVQNYWCRVVSMLFGLATLPLLFGAARRIFNARTALVATSLAALWPLHINVGAAAGNDTAVGFFCALLFYIMARGSDEKSPGEETSPSIKTSAAMGAVIGLAMLSKSSALTVCVAALGWLLHLSWKNAPRKERLRFTLRNGATALCVAALLCGPWLWRNQILYGDVLAVRAFDEAFRNSSPRPAMFFAQGIDLFTYVRALLLIMFSTMWGFFGGPNTALRVLNVFGKDGPAREAFDASPLMLICAAALLVALFGLWRYAWHDLWNRHRVVLLWWLLGLLAVWLGWVNFNLIQFQGQARYVHPALLPMASLMALGWLQLFAPRENEAPPALAKWAGGAFALTLLALSLWNIFGWKTLV